MRSYGGLTNWVLAGVLITQAVCLCISVPQLSPTRDEPAHLAAGLEYWRTGRADVYNVNPPLVRLWATWPLAFFTDSSVPHVNNTGTTIERYEFIRGNLLRDALGKDFLYYLFLSRYMCIPLVMIGTIGVYCLSCTMFNKTAGLVAAILWALNPIVLGYGSLLTCDIAAGSAGVWAVYTGLLAARSGSLHDSVVAGVVLGLAVLTKTIWLIALGLWPVGAAWLLYTRLRSLRRFRQSQFGPTFSKVCSDAAVKCTLLLILAWSVVLLGYRFNGVFIPLGDYSFVSQTLKGPIDAPSGNRFRDSSLGLLPVPFPAAMVRGIDQQWQDFDTPLKCYLFGEWQSGGWYYFYAIALLVKLPLGLLLLGVLSIRRWSTNAEAIVCCGCLSLIVFVLVSAKTNMNEHSRYLWSILPLLCVLASAAVVLAPSRSIGVGSVKLNRLICAACTCWVAAAGVTTVPFGLGYSNEFVGGVPQTWKVLAGSNVDWDHGWLAARNWLAHQHPAMPIALVEPHDGYFESISLATVRRPPDFLVNSDSGEVEVLLLVSTENRMRMRQGDIDRVAVVGCCIEVYRSSLIEIAHFSNVRWYVSALPIGRRASPP